MEIPRLLQKLQVFICWDITTAVSSEGTKLPHIISRIVMGLHSTVVFILGNSLFVGWEYHWFH